ncbi:LURP-one-related/scramblase family protein [Corynebacterium uberis]|uniref:LURP-one-related/scramblase family protein n=1 Tax=Corynebacterium TaxID=1716 RepID=UPI001D0B08BE|nr:MULTISPECIES: phospholipid scramblase-related protein [Corynebacterium]MCZ9309568.1 hypothetical protein [Corynebacterium sp. c6VSa_13]UDL73381.1 hypothetical protein LH391_09885 [Corynebacterium uberis]UDL75740.1 hypothetical protein LH393_11040 [Corynebacterium uberis]UDL77952.1 hypothetical protein LH394_11025 [Corynebacterium uberis]UDL80236.1 hypothetical protein LH392_11445 [Corynebacterium uberis]
MDTHAHAQPRLLRTDELILQQVSAMASNNFEITDSSETVVGTVVTEGSALGRAFLGARELTICDDTGATVVHISDTPNFLHDTYELSDAAGAPLAHLDRRYAFFSDGLNASLADGTTLTLSGKVFSFDFTVTRGDDTHPPIATISRQWAGLGRGLLGHSRYALSFDPHTLAKLRAAVLGTVVALDLLRAKKNNNS